MRTAWVRVKGWGRVAVSQERVKGGRGSKVGRDGRWTGVRAGRQCWVTIKR